MQNEMYCYLGSTVQTNGEGLHVTTHESVCCTSCYMVCWHTADIHGVFTPLLSQHGLVLASMGTLQETPCYGCDFKHCKASTQQHFPTWHGWGLQGCTHHPMLRAKVQKSRSKPATAVVSWSANSNGKVKAQLDTLRPAGMDVFFSRIQSLGAN